MNILTWEISLTKEQLGYEKLTPPASVTGYLLDPVSLSATRRRPAVIICPGGGYGHLSDREGIFIPIFDITKVISFLHFILFSLCHIDRKSTRLNSSHMSESRMPSSA